MTGKHRATGPAHKLINHRTKGVKTLHLVGHVLVEISAGVIAIKLMDSMGGPAATTTALAGMVTYLHV